MPVKKKKTNTPKLSDAQLDSLYSETMNNLQVLQSESENGTARARTLYYAVAGFIVESGIVEELLAMYGWMDEQRKKTAAIPLVPA